MDDKRVLPSESNMNTLSSLSTATYLGVLNVVSPRVPSLLPPSLAFPTTVDTEEVTIYLMNSIAPCIIRDETSSYLYLILPINVSNSNV